MLYEWFCVKVTFHQGWERTLTSPQTLAFAQHLPLLHVVPNAHCRTMAPHNQNGTSTAHEQRQELHHAMLYTPWLTPPLPVWCCSAQELLPCLEAV